MITYTAVPPQPEELQRYPVLAEEPVNDAAARLDHLEVLCALTRNLADVVDELRALRRDLVRAFGHVSDGLPYAGRGEL